MDCNRVLSIWCVLQSAMCNVDYWLKLTTCCLQSRVPLWSSISLIIDSDTKPGDNGGGSPRVKGAKRSPAPRKGWGVRVISTLATHEMSVWGEAGKRPMLRKKPWTKRKGVTMIASPAGQQCIDWGCQCEEGVKERPVPTQRDASRGRAALTLTLAAILFQVRIFLGLF